MRSLLLLLQLLVLLHIKLLTCVAAAAVSAAVAAAVAAHKTAPSAFVAVVVLAFSQRTASHAPRASECAWTDDLSEQTS